MSNPCAPFSCDRRLTSEGYTIGPTVAQIRSAQMMQSIRIRRCIGESLRGPRSLVTSHSVIHNSMDSARDWKLVDKAPETKFEVAMMDHSCTRN